MKITITELCDEYDCEDCGGSWATGYEVFIDGKQFGDYTPIAHCYNGQSFELENVLVDVMKHLGHEVEFK